MGVEAFPFTVSLWFWRWVAIVYFELDRSPWPKTIGRLGAKIGGNSNGCETPIG